MAIRTYKVTLDTKNSIAPEPVFLRQGDKTGAVVIDATLMDNGAPVSLDGLTPMFKANTADGQAVIADSTGFNVLNSANGEFTYQVPNALSAVPGKIATAYFSLSDAGGSESTFDVAFVVKMAVDMTQKQAEDYITIIDGTLKSLSDKIDAMNTDVKTILDAYNQGDFYNKSETDSRDASTLASAKSYTDSGDSTTLTNAKSYADTQDSATLSSAKSYTDNISKDWLNAAMMTKDTGWVALSPLNGTTWTSQPCMIRRIGFEVFYRGTAYPKNVGEFATIPVGFRPTMESQFDCAQRSTTMPSSARVYADGATLKLTAITAMDAGIALVSVRYLSDEAFPTI